MRWFCSLMIYRLVLPLLFVAAFPGWIMKMLRRGGFGTRMGERAAIYTTPLDFEPYGAIHVHAISVGESLLALKLIREWRILQPEQRFVLATGTATGHAVATAAGIPELRVCYAPLDLPSMIQRYFKRFSPAKIILIESEVWPHLLIACQKKNIPIALVNARVSPRSMRRYQRFAAWLRPLFSMLDLVAIQKTEDAALWKSLGVDARKIHHTGSLKFDPTGGTLPQTRPDFQNLLDTFGKGKSVILAASTHAGEDAWIATAVRDAMPEALLLIVPRHAERRWEVKQQLERAGFTVVLRSQLDPSAPPKIERGPILFLIDSTGELRDWTAHADAVIIGKSFLATGGQNPTEAIQAHRPVIFGPHMENFEPLASRLVANGGCIRAINQSELANAITTVFDPSRMNEMTQNASTILRDHEGATLRILDLLRAPALFTK